MIDLFNKLEKKWNNKLKKDSLWSFMRMKYYYALLEKYTKTKHSSTSIRNKINYIGNMFYGISNFLKKYDYFFFSDSGQRKKINGKYFDKLTDPIIDKLGEDKCLQFELPSPKLYKIDDCYHKNIISQTGIELIGFIFTKIYLIFNLKKTDYSLYENINDELNIELNYKFYKIFFELRYKIFKFIFKIKKPKAIFIVCYYDKAYIVKAAKDLNIKVIELQHGIIGEIHPAYFSSIELDKSFVPNYLLSFGNYEKIVMSNSREIKGIYKKEEIYPIGHFYIEYLVRNFQKNDKFSNIIMKYDLIFGITLQDSIENELLKEIEKIASIYKDYLFILIPRNPSYKYNGKIKNIIVINALDCYQILLHCDFHITVYSSCAIESPSLGVANILFNIHNFSIKYFKNMLSSKNTIIINNIEEFNNFIKNKNFSSKKEVINSNTKLIIQNYNKNIINFLKENILC